MAVYYTEEHEWISVGGDTATVGITDFAQGQLGDIVFVELPEAGRRVTKGGEAAVVESAKAASDVYAPVDGEVIERNEEVVASPELVNSSPYDRAWLIKVRVTDPSQVDRLLAPADYDAFADTASTH